MNKVTIINLNGKAYQIEEMGYELLRKYLDQAAAKLEGNPDKDEIMGDFEQAIAEKCEYYLKDGKDVITTSEIEAILAKMGNVETETGGQYNASPTGNPLRRLYRIVEGEWIAGVCNGLGAYFNLDTTLIRIIFVILAFLTHGFMVGVYIILAIAMPVARTEEEQERARGQAPFDANEFIEQAKQRYAEFQKKHPHSSSTSNATVDKEAWQSWKEEMKQWKYEWRADRHAEKARRKSEKKSIHNHEMSGSGFFRFVLGLLVTALVVIWALALWSILLHGLVFGYPIATLHTLGTGIGSHPTILAIILITALLYVLVLPLKLLIKNAQPQRWGHYSFFNDLIQSIFFLFALFVLFYTAGLLFPVVHEALNMVITSIKAL